MKFTKESIIERKMKNLLAIMYDEYVQIPKWHASSAVFLREKCYADHKDVGVLSIGDSWTCYDTFTMWFKAEVTVPTSFEGKPLVLELDFGGEAIVRINGEIISALTSYLSPSVGTRTRVFVTASAVPETVYNIEIEAHLNYMEFSYYRRAGDTKIDYTIRTAAMASVNTTVEDYYFDLAVALDSMETLKNPLDKITKSNTALPSEILDFFESISKDPFFFDKIADAVVSSISCVDFDFDRAKIIESIPNASKMLKEKMKTIPNNSHGNIKFVGQGHIDLAWLWPEHESVRKTAKTLSNVCALMDRYPGFTFAFSQPKLFELVKDNYPELYDRVKEKVANGQFEIVGNTWVEMDTNIPSGESLIRQILYGRQFFLDEFGKCSDVFWMPDVFGYSWALPQIIKKSGMNYFYTSKLINNDDNRFPHSLFKWQGIDGTTVTAYLQRMNYNGDICPYTINTLYQRYDQKAIHDEAFMTFGYGDGGGGPSYQMLEREKRLRNCPGLPKIEMSTSLDYFKGTDKVSDEIPVWNDEMYYEHHRGTYTSQAKTKKNNRKSELLYRQAEMSSVISGIYAGKEYPYSDFLTGYKKLLSNQFHDIIPGSSINSVYHDADASYAQVRSIGENILDDSLQAILSNIECDKNDIVVFNFLSWSRKGNVCVDISSLKTDSQNDFAIYDQSNNLVPSITYDKNDKFFIEFVADAPSMGHSKYSVKRTKAETNLAVFVSHDVMENDFYLIKLDDKYNILSIYDKVNRRECLSGESNVLKIFEDKPSGETAWNIDLEYQNKEWSVESVASVEILCTGSVKGVLRVKRTFNKSVFTQDIVLYSATDRIDFINYIDWQETEKMLKAEFQTDILSSKAAYEIQFGTIERPTHSNTSFDKTKFEVSAHKWADLSEGNYGVSLLNDCKYGYDIKDSRMRITLLRSSIDPDPIADRGYHEFTYSIRPHAGSWAVSETVNAGYELNVPLLAVLCNEKSQSNTLPPVHSFIECSKKNVIVDTLKCAEDKNGVILRVYESSGTKTKTSIKYNMPLNSVSECNLIEEGAEEISNSNNSFDFVIGPFEIKTFRIK